MNKIEFDFNNFVVDEIKEFRFIKVSQPKTMKVRKCDCGACPNFATCEDSDHIVLCRLECANCGLSTINTAGFWYAHEYTELEAKIRAVDRWNRREFDERCESK